MAIDCLTSLMIPTSKMARKIGSGVYGRLEFDFACNRGHGFGEAYLHGVLIELLASNVDPKSENILPSYAVPILQNGQKGASRKREVDFAVGSRQQDVVLSLCIEAKWAGSSHASADNVLSDVARLALIAHEQADVACLFVLAGGKTAVQKLLNTGVLGSGNGPRNYGLLRFPYNSRRPRRYYVTAGGGHKSDLPSSSRVKLEAKLPTLPAHVSSFLYKPTHDDPPDWRVYVWRIGG